MAEYATVLSRKTVCSEEFQMIRMGKPVQLLEWGKGTSTLTQVWSLFATGGLTGKPRTVDGLTDVAIEIEGKFEKQNAADETVKIMQQGEGMTPASQKWGEVAMGNLSRVEETGGKTILHISIRNATKVGKALKK